MMEDADMSSSRVITFIRSEGDIADVEYKLIDTRTNTMRTLRRRISLQDFAREFPMIPLFPETRKNKIPTSQEII